MRGDLKKIANPYTLFAISWSLCLLLYPLGWSEIFPKLSNELLIFLIISIAVFAISGFFYGRVKYFVAPDLNFKLRYKKLLIINFLLYLVNFAYSGIPVLKGFRDTEFGIPTVVVIAITLNSFCSVYCFYLFLIKNERRFLWYMIACLLMFILSYSRGYVIMNGISMFFLWMNVKHPVLSIKKVLIIISSSLLVLYLFGVAGNYRAIGEIASRDPKVETSYNNDMILTVGHASDSFKNNWIPNEYFWTYIYITSPLSNLQYNITNHAPDFTFSGVFHLVIDELLFDTFSKRINASLNREKPSPDLIVEALTVPTTLAGSYNYAGWIGMGIFICVFWTIPLTYILLVSRNPYGIIGISTLCTIFFLSIFDNMLILTGLSFQLLYPLILFFLSKINWKA